MPFLPREVRQRIDRRQKETKGHDWLGEEGILHRVSFDGEGQKRYVAKQWYSTAEKRQGMPIESGGSPTSPYWHKVKFHEYGLIHSAFPDQTVEIVAGFDERIHRGPNGEYNFVFQTGRPVTMTKEVEADPTLMAERDAIVDPLYERMFAYHTATQHGRTATPEQRAQFYHVIAQANVELDQLFGPELMQLPVVAHEGESISSIDVTTVRQVAEKLTVTDPTNPLAHFWQYGILAIHPQLNFIPEGAGGPPGKVRGKYIEFIIFDLQRFHDQWNREHSPEETARVVPKITRYYMYRVLDDLFCRIVLLGSYNTQLHLDTPEVQTAVFHITEALRKKCEQYSPRILPQCYDPILAEVKRRVENARMENDLVAALEQMVHDIDEYTVE